MNDERADRPASRVTPRGMVLGGLVGAGVGAVVRGGVVFYHLREGEAFGFLASLPSAGIGLLCGAVAGCVCRGWLGGLFGAVLSGGVFGLFVLPCAFVFAEFDAVHKLAGLTWPLFVELTAAGALAGAVGGHVGGRIVQGDRERAAETSPP